MQLRHLAGQRPAEKHLFLNRRGEPLSRFGIHTLVERYITKLRTSIPSLRGMSISPHVIRRTAATHLLWCVRQSRTWGAPRSQARGLRVGLAAKRPFHREIN